MKLYLTSYRIPTPDDLLDLTQKRAGDARIAIVANAKDYLIERARKVKVRSIGDYFGELGFKKTDELDLRNYDDSRQLKTALARFDIVFLAGGNTFCLMEQIYKSGLNKIINDLLEKGLVYVGESAGAVAAGKSLRGVELDDEPEFAEKQYWEGLGLVDKFILPHADNRYFADSNQHSELIYKPDEIIKLNDNQALVVSHSELRVVSSEP